MWPSHTSRKPKVTGGRTLEPGELRAWLSLHLGSLALGLALIRVCFIKFVKVSGVG